MKNLVAACILCLSSTLVSAEESNWFNNTKPVLCGNLNEVITTLLKKYQEYPIFLGEDGSNDSRYSLFVNKESGSWTIIQFTKNIACVLGMGNSGKTVNPPNSF